MPPKFNPSKLKKLVEPQIRQIFYQAVLQDQIEIIDYILQNWHTENSRLIHTNTQSQSVKKLKTLHLCQKKSCFVLKAIEENQLEFLVKVRLYLKKPCLPLCFPTGFQQAYLGRWDLFKLILPSNNQVPWMTLKPANISLLDIAANQNNAEMIETIILWYGFPKVDLDKNILNAIYKAVRKDQAEVVRRLIHLIEFRGFYKWQLIKFAAQKNHNETLRVLETVQPVCTLQIEYHS